jgi:hypothetical protein
MAKKNSLMLITIFVTSLIFIVFQVNGYSQQNPGTVKKTTDQKEPAAKELYKNRFTAQVGLEVIADLSADKLTHTGPCPTAFTFKGRISTNRAMTLHYRFIRSDDVRTLPVMIKLAKGETKEMTYSWEIGGDPNGPPEFNGWIFLQAVYPTNMKTSSNVVNIKGTCTNRDNKPMQENIKQPDPFSQQKGQKTPGIPFPGSPAQMYEGKGPVTEGPSMILQGQKGPGNLPLPQPGQTGQGPGNMPIFQPSQKGPMPVGSPILPGSQKGPMPDTISMPSRNQQGQPIALKEDCISFNPDTTTMEQASFGWRVMDGSQTIFGFDFDKAEASIALATIKHYKMTQSCFVGRPKPSFHYMLAGGSAPVGPFRPKDCSPFNPATTNIEEIKGSWRIADGGKRLFDFGEKKDEADQALAIIKKYGFTYSCMIAQGKVEYMYLRK